MNFSEHYLVEEEQKTVVVYAGRFQPFHVGHYQTYLRLINKFGKENVFIGTSNKVEENKSPFDFEDKKKIITKMFDIDPEKVVMVRRPYAPEEILSKFPKNTAYVTAVGSKDSDRLSTGKYFDEYEEDKKLKGYEDKGYVFITAPNDKYYKNRKISGTLIRDILLGGDKKEKRKLFDTIYPDFNEDIFTLIMRKVGGKNG